MDTERNEILGERYFYAEIVGPPGSGKSRLSDLLAVITNLPKIEENFLDVKRLHNFYTENPGLHSFFCQSSFVVGDTDNARNMSALTLSRPVFQDAGRHVNPVIARAQRRLGYMTGDEYRTYLKLCSTMYRGCLEPDVIICLKAPVQMIIDGIRERNRPDEVDMLNNHPEYFPAVVSEFDLAIPRLKRTHKVAVLDISTPLFRSQNRVDYLALAQQTLKWTGYYLSSQNQLNGVGSDGKKLIFPSFLR